MEELFSKLAGKNFLLNLFILGRPWNGVIIGLIAILIYLVQGGKDFVSICFIFLAFFLQYFGGAVVNDLSDFFADSLNMPFRPLEQKVVTLNQAKLLAIFAYIFSFVLALVFNFYLFLGILAFFIFTIVYSVKPFRLVSKGFFGNLSLGVVSIFIPSFTGLILATFPFNILSPIFGFIVFFTLFFSFFYLIKDFKDLQGDKASNKITFALKHGVNFTVKLSMLGASFFFFLASYCFYLLVPSDLVIFSAILFLILFLYFESILLKKEDYVGVFFKTRILFMFFLLSLFIIVIYVDF